MSQYLSSSKEEREAEYYNNILEKKRQELMLSNRGIVEKKIKDAVSGLTGSKYIEAIEKVYNEETERINMEAKRQVIG